MILSISPSPATQPVYGGGGVDGWVKQTFTQETGVYVPCETNHQRGLPFNLGNVRYATYVTNILILETMIFS